RQLLVVAVDLDLHLEELPAIAALALGFLDLRAWEAGLDGLDHRRRQLVDRDVVVCERRSSRQENGRQGGGEQRGAKTRNVHWKPPATGGRCRRAGRMPAACPPIAAAREVA